MIVLQIEDVKTFMSQLFVGDMFDKFHVNGCQIATFTEFEVSGKRCREWYDTDELSENVGDLVVWQQLKPMIFSLIKGKKTPSKMKIDFCHYLENGDCGSIRIQYEKDELYLYTGYMQKEFSLTKEKQNEWDDNCLNFIKKNEITSTQVD